MNRRLFSLSPIGGEGRGEGARRFMVTTRVNNLRSSLSMNRWFFSLSHRMGEGWGEGPLRFMVTTRVNLLPLSCSRNSALIFLHGRIHP